MRRKKKDKNKILVLIDGKCRRFDRDKMRVYYTNIVVALLGVGRKKKDKNKILVLIDGKCRRF